MQPEDPPGPMCTAVRAVFKIGYGLKPLFRRQLLYRGRTTWVG
jgi:hypothetical protein